MSDTAQLCAWIGPDTFGRIVDCQEPKDHLWHRHDDSMCFMGRDCDQNNSACHPFVHLSSEVELVDHRCTDSLNGCGQNPCEVPPHGDEQRLAALGRDVIAWIARDVEAFFSWEESEDLCPLLEAYGFIARDTYDPAKHGEENVFDHLEPGDEGWFFTPAFWRAAGESR